MSEEFKKIYLSYARKDDPEFTERLYLDLTAAGFSVWMDKYDMSSRGAPYNKEMIDAIEHAERLLLVVGPEALTSDYVNWEWKYAVEFGKAINPVIRIGSYKDFPYELKKLDAPDFREDKNYQKSFEKLTHQLKEPPAVLGKLIGVPLLAPNFLILADKIKSIQESLLADIHRPVVVTRTQCITGVHGMGGIGKTEIAKAIARNPEVRRVFPDGIFWITVGRTTSIPSLLSLQSQIVQELGEPFRAFEDLQQGRMRLSSLLSNRACLFILDDVWDYEDTKAFDVLGPRCRMLVTTRDAEIITALGATEHRLDVLSNEDALELLASWVGQNKESLPADSEELIRECENLPLAITLCGANIRDGMPYRDLIYSLQNAKLEYLDRANGSVLSSIKTSVDALPPFEAKKYLRFAAFPEDKQIPEHAVLTLWLYINGINEADGRRLFIKFKNKNLLKLEEKELPRKISLHDLQYDYVRSSFSNPQEPHENIIEAYGKKCNGEWHKGLDDGYFFSHLAYHLAQAGKKQELEKLLFNFKWLQARLDATDIYGLIDDFDHLKDDEDARLVKGALQLSIHALANDKRQLAGQLLGRLLDQESKKIQNLLEQAKEKKDYPWLRPIKRSLHPSGSALLMTLVGHKDGVNSVAVFADGKKAISASDDNTLKVWNLESGKEIRTLEGHTYWVRAVAVLPDGKKAISASGDKTLKVWDLESGKEIRTLEGHTGWVNAVAVLPDGKKAISASGDNTLKVWDLESGKEIRTLEGHTDWVNAVAVLPDGKKAISASSDNTLKVWDLESGKEIRTLEGHTSWVYAVAVLPDGKKAISASWDNTLKVWDLESGKEIRTLEGHTESIYAVAVLPDGKKSISASGDKTLKVWDLESGKEIRTLEGHTVTVYAVAVLPDGKKAISASYDRTLKVWDLESGKEIRTLKGHTESVFAVVVLPDGKKAISASEDRTLKVWDLESGKEIRTLEGHTNWVSEVAVLPDGKKAISASSDRTLKIWDLESGKEIRTLEGHANWVYAVALFPDGKKAISASADRTLKIWDLESGKEIRTLEGHTSWVTAVAVLPDGKKAISASWDNTLKVWDLESGKEIRTLEGHTESVYAVAVLLDGKKAISASDDRTLKVWDLESGKEIRTLEGHTYGVNAVAVLPDGKKAISASKDRTLKVWDFKNYNCIATFIGDSILSCCAASSDGKTIVVGDGSGAIHLLRLEMPDEE